MADAKQDPKTNPSQSPSTPAPDPQAAPTAAVAPDERYRKVAVDEQGSVFAYNDTSKKGVTVNRIDFIRSAWTVGKKGRGAIAKELTRLTGKKVTYQIIFSATKGVAGGPPAAAATPATPA